MRKNLYTLENVHSEQGAGGCMSELAAKRGQRTGVLVSGPRM